jgi:hypothetical protein
MGAINLNHNTSTISTGDTTPLGLQVKGGIKIGEGTYLNEDNEVEDFEIQESYKGALRYNSDLGCLQVCDGKTWNSINGQYKYTSDIVWSLLF